ncbi:hypothetical protein [Halodesulfovibrio sp. MK-HDV]|jgi:hypothetical protein|uniref:hypothetical protein n=1 Tax=Halodesulfovibrio sp. MK-HDV TaxID=2599925 RepID=UPI00136AF8D1|nr:hypothetical protein [Halodesulfovibrio sp. MK-HDV]KAF1077629.1 hypothetical protein MKHDV_00085 [Halodesulfovibrio sp. MK-HDV]
MISVTITTQNGVCKVYNLPSHFKNNLAEAPYHLEVAEVNNTPVVACCDTCGRPICSGDNYSTRQGFVWCNLCSPADN